MVNNNISLEAISNEMTALEKEAKGDKENQVANILSEILKNIKPVNFRDYCKLVNDKEKLQKKHYLVSCIEILIKNVNDDGFSLCRKNDRIYLFNSEYWENINEEVFKDFLGNVSLKMGVDKFDAKHHLFKDEIYKQFLSDGGVKEIKSSSATTLVNFNNGTFEITPKKQFLRDFRKSDFLTYQLPFSYNQDATAPRFQKFLDEVIPETELQEVLAEYLGYIFIKNTVLKLEKVLILLGSGRNGKSVLYDIILALFGAGNVSGYSLQSLTAENGNARAMIQNKLLNYAPEISGKLKHNIFKTLISGEEVEARLLYKNTQMIKGYSRFMFNCNELPKEVENTTGYFRRFLILPFRFTIPTNKVDPDLAKKIINSELSGVFNWVLVGLIRLLENKKFTISEIIENQTLQYQKESDSVLMYLEDEDYQKSVVNDRPLKDLYLEYDLYCKSSGYHQCSLRTFSNRLKKNGFMVKRKSYGNAIYIEKKRETRSEEEVLELINEIDF